VDLDLRASAPEPVPPALQLPVAISASLGKPRADHYRVRQGQQHGRAGSASTIGEPLRCRVPPKSVGWPLQHRRLLRQSRPSEPKAVEAEIDANEPGLGLVRPELTEPVIGLCLEPAAVRADDQELQHAPHNDPQHDPRGYWVQAAAQAVQL